MSIGVGSRLGTGVGSAAALGAVIGEGDGVMKDIRPSPPVLDSAVNSGRDKLNRFSGTSSSFGGVGGLAGTGAERIGTFSVGSGKLVAAAIGEIALGVLAVGVASESSSVSLYLESLSP